MYTLKKDTEINAQVLQAVIDYNDLLAPRFNKMENYYFGKHAVLDRTKLDNDINNRIVINHAKYITDTNIGYLLGTPVDYKANDEKVDIEPVIEAYRNQNISDLDSEIAKDISIFGLQHEYVYENEDGETKSSNVDNRNTIIVHDTSLDHKKLFGIMYQAIYENNRKTPSHYKITYADKENVIEYQLTTGKSPVLTEETKTPHGFGGVPMIEYKNNSDYIGDFEQVLSLIDAYNVLQSDRVNDKEQFVDAVLTVYGATITPAQMIELRDNRVISGIPEDAKIEYLTKNFNEADADTLRKNIEADIHKISMTPNMTDSEFVGNSSGVAIRYKLLAFEQNTKTKERFMERGLMERFQLYWNQLTAKSKTKGKFKTSDVDAVFNRNLPTNDVEMAQILQSLDGMVSKETLLGQLSFVKDASQEITRAKKEAEERVKQLAKTFTADEQKNQDEDNEDTEE